MQAQQFHAARLFRLAGDFQPLCWVQAELACTAHVQTAQTHPGVDSQQHRDTGARIERAHCPGPFGYRIDDDSGRTSRRDLLEVGVALADSSYDDVGRGQTRRFAGAPFARAGNLGTHVACRKLRDDSRLGIRLERVEQPRPIWEQSGERRPRAFQFGFVVDVRRRRD